MTDLIVQSVVGALLIAMLVWTAAFIWHGRRLPRWREPSTHGRWITPVARLPFDEEAHDKRP